MSSSDIEIIAQLVATIGVMQFMLTVAWQIRENTQQSQLSNQGVFAERCMSIYRETDNIESANLVAKGRKSYLALT